MSDIREKDKISLAVYHLKYVLLSEEAQELVDDYYVWHKAELQRVIGEDGDTVQDAEEALSAGVAVTSGKILGRIDLRAEQRKRAGL